MSKVKINNEKMSELFTIILDGFGDLIRTDELKWGIADNFIQGCGENGVTFSIDESKFPKSVRRVTKEKPETGAPVEELAQKEQEQVQKTMEKSMAEPADISRRDMKAKGDAFNKFLKRDNSKKTGTTQPKTDKK